jgi:hypothetical protein
MPRNYKQTMLEYCMVEDEVAKLTAQSQEKEQKNEEGSSAKRLNLHVSFQNSLTDFIMMEKGNHQRQSVESNAN